MRLTIGIGTPEKSLLQAGHSYAMLSQPYPIRCMKQNTLSLILLLSVHTTICLCQSHWSGSSFRCHLEQRHRCHCFLVFRIYPNAVLCSHAVSQLYQRNVHLSGNGYPKYTEKANRRLAWTGFWTSLHPNQWISFSDRLKNWCLSQFLQYGKVLSEYKSFGKEPHHCKS